jgi:excisionase family DNA binding protein
MDLPDPWTQPLLTVRQAAQCLGISESTARRQISQLDLPTVDLGGWRRVATSYVYETLGLPLPPRPVTWPGITLADLEAASRPLPGPPW